MVNNRVIELGCLFYGINLTTESVILDQKEWYESEILG